MRIQKGYTLVELMIVVAIISLLATTLIPKIMNSRDEVKLAKTITDAYAIKALITGRDTTPEKTIQLLQNSAEFSQLENYFDKSIQGVYNLAIKNSDTIPNNKEIIVYSEQPVQATISNFPDGVIAVYKNNVYYKSQKNPVIDGFIVDVDGNRLAGVAVELHSTPRIVITNEDGYFIFTNTTIEEHTLSIRQENNQGIDVSKINLSIKMGDEIIKSNPGNPSITFQLKSNLVTVNSGVGEVGEVTDVTPTPSPSPQPSPQPVNTLEQFKLGDYIKYGVFNGHDLIWQVVKKSDENIMLFGSDALKLVNGLYYVMHFDVAPNAGEPTDLERTTYGSSNYELSDIRIWLNGQFYNTAFQNKSYIADTVHQFTLNKIDKEIRDDLQKDIAHIYNSTFSTSLQNYNVANKRTITDKVYLVSIEELVQDIAPVIGTNNYWNSSYKYWLRDASGSSYSSRVRYVNYVGGISEYAAYNEDGRVRIAINLKSADVKSGTGSMEDPYILQ